MISERSMEVLFDDGKGSIFQESLKWLDSKQEHLQLSGALALGNFARSGTDHLSHITRKPVFGVCDQVRLKPACSAKETSQSLKILDLVSIVIILSRQRKTKALSRLCGCAG